MSIDFDRLVVGRLQAIFGKPIVVTPLASQPGAAPYVARGDLRIQNIDMPLEEGAGIMSTQVISMGVRKADFAVFVAPGDKILIGFVLVAGAAVGGTAYLIDDTDDDAQGHSILTLKRVDQS